MCRRYFRVATFAHFKIQFILTSARRQHFQRNSLPSYEKGSANGPIIQFSCETRKLEGSHTQWVKRIGPRVNSLNF